MILSFQADLWQMPWVSALLRLPVLGVAAEAVTYAVMALCVVLLVNVPSLKGHRRCPALAVAAGIGAAVGVTVTVLADQVLSWVPGGIPPGARAWLVAASTVLGLGCVAVGQGPGLRRVLAFVLLIPVGVTTAVGVNASYGLLGDIGSLMGRSSSRPVGVDHCRRCRAGRRTPRSGSPRGGVRRRGCWSTDVVSRSRYPVRSRDSEPGLRVSTFRRLHWFRMLLRYRSW